MKTLHIVSADVRQYWNKYVRFHRGRVGIWVMVGYLILLYGFLSESGDAIVALPVISRFSLNILLTIVTVFSEGWSRSYQYFFVRQEARLLRNFRVPVVSMVLSFTLVSIVETIPATLTYSLTLSFSHQSGILLFSLLFLFRIATAIAVSWLVAFFMTSLKLGRGLFVALELFLKITHSVVLITFAFVLLFRHQTWFLAVAGGLNRPWVLYGLLVSIWGSGLVALVVMNTQWFSARFRARSDTQNARGVLGRRKRVRWIPSHPTAALVVKDIYGQIGTSYLFRLVIFIALQLFLHINVFFIPVLPSRHLNFLSVWLLAPSRIGGVTLWLIIILFLEPFSTVFQNEESVKRLYWLFHIPLRKVLFAKWIFTIAMGMTPMVIGLFINGEWIMTSQGIWNVILNVFILSQLISWEVLISSFLLVSTRGIMVDQTNLQQVSQVPSATIALWVGVIDLILVTYLAHLMYTPVLLMLNLLLFVVTTAFLIGYWPLFLRNWYRRRSL